MAESNEGLYSRSRPPQHTRVCWAAALGYARRGQGQYESLESHIATALAFLAEHPEACICPRRSTRNSRPRR